MLLTSVPGSSTAPLPAPALSSRSSNHLQRAFPTAAFNPLLALAHSCISCVVTGLKLPADKSRKAQKSPQRSSKQKRSPGSRGKPGQLLCSTSCRHHPRFWQPSHSPAHPQRNPSLSLLWYSQASDAGIWESQAQKPRSQPALSACELQRRKTQML